jgi:transposase
MFIMPKAFPLEFRRDVVAVARKGEAPLSQIAKDFGISESCLHRWLKLGHWRCSVTSATGPAREMPSPSSAPCSG